MSQHSGAFESVDQGRPARSGVRSGSMDPFRPILSQIARYWWVERAGCAVGGHCGGGAEVEPCVGGHGRCSHRLDVPAVRRRGLRSGGDGSRQALAVGDFGGLFTAAGLVALIEPVATFADFAEILGFVFLLIGVRWIVQAFFERAFNDLWWLTLMSGILMTVLAFWVSGQFFLERAYTLLVFAGIWALLVGITASSRLPDPPRSPSGS